MDRPALPRYSKAEMLLMTALAAFDNQEDCGDARGFVLHAFQALTDTARACTGVYPPLVDEFIALARARRPDRELMPAARQIAAAIPDAQFHAVLAQVVGTDMAWTLRASHAPAGTVQ